MAGEIVTVNVALTVRSPSVVWIFRDPLSAPFPEVGAVIESAGAEVNDALHPSGISVIDSVPEPLIVRGISIVWP